MSTQVKYCGITRLQDALFAAEAGVDAIGFVFDPASPRFIPLPQAVMIRGRLPSRVTAVALFRNTPAAQVAQVLAALGPAVAQFHGDESAQACEASGPGYWRAVPMAGATDLPAFAKRHPGAAALLLDAHRAGEAGGQGKTFDWAKVPKGLALPIVLAGGLTPENVGAAIRQVRPYMVDVSSGIESARGIKDEGKMRSFMDAVKKADGR
jgi:phosphoribosylanthranilate isomerase